MSDGPTIPHAFHADIEQLLTSLANASQAIKDAPPPHPNDPVLYGDARTHQVRVLDFEKHRQQAIEAIGQARLALESRVDHRRRMSVDVSRNSMSATDASSHEQHERMLADSQPSEA